MGLRVQRGSRESVLTEVMVWNFTIINTRSGLHSGFRTDFKFNICDLILELLQPASNFLECPLEIVSAFVRCSPNICSILALIRSCVLLKTECWCVLPSPCGVYVRADATLHRVHAPIQQMYINGETPSGLYSKLVQVPSSYWFLQQAQRSCHKQGSSADQISAVLLGSFRSHIFRLRYGQLNTLRGLSHRWCSRFELQLQGWKPFSAKLGIVFSWYTKWLLCSVVDHDTLAYGVNGHLRLYAVAVVSNTLFPNMLVDVMVIKSSTCLYNAWVVYMLCNLFVFASW